MDREATEEAVEDTAGEVLEDIGVGGSDKPKAKKSLRKQYMGNTPGKKSRTGREVIDRMKSEGTIDETGKRFMYDGEWYNIADADMGHKTDAVKWLNEIGRFSGPKSKLLEILC